MKLLELRLFTVILPFAAESPAKEVVGSAANGAARVAYAKTILGGLTYSLKSPVAPKWEWDNTMVRGKSSEFRFDDKCTDCVETSMNVLRKTDPEIYEAITEKAGSGRGGRVGNVKTKIENRGGKFRKTDPKEGDLMIWHDAKTGNGHIEMVMSTNAKKIHGVTFIETYGSGSNKIPVPRITGTDWLKVGEEFRIHSPSPFAGYWTPH